jgi:hypothetical protein
MFKLMKALIVLAAITLIMSAQLGLCQSIIQISTSSINTEHSSTQDEGLTPASGHFMPRNMQISKSNEDEVIVSIPNSMADSGQVRTDGITNSYANVGSALSADSAAFLSFDISSIPKDANIKDAKLKFEGFDIVGEPFSNLGCLNIYPASYRTLATQFYSMASIMSYLKICSQSQLYSPLASPYLTTAVRASLGNDKLQLRLQFDREGESLQQEGTVVTKYTLSGGTESTDYKNGYADNYPSSVPTYNEENYMGFDQAFLQSDFGDHSEGRNSRYVAISPNTNLSQLGITQEMIEEAIDPNRVRVAMDIPTGRHATLSTDAINEIKLPRPAERYPNNPVNVDKTDTFIEYETQKSQDLIKSGVAWLTVIYSLPKEHPNLGPNDRFKLPDNRYLINWTDNSCGVVPANQFLVLVNSSLGFEDAGALASHLAAELKGSVVGQFQYLNLFQIETRSSTKEELIGDISYARNYNLIDLAFPNYQLCHESGSPLDDKVYQGESGKDYRIIGLQQSWDLIKYSKIPLSEAHVGVTDDGLYKGYGEFHKSDINTSMKICPEAPPSLLDAPLQNYEIAGSHGTGIMNIIAADDDDGGLVGITTPVISTDKKIKFDMVNIYVENRAFITTSLLGLKAEIENGCTILSCSWGNSHTDEQATEMYEELFEKLSRDYPMLLFIFSAGNDGMEIDGNIRIPNGLPNGPLPNSITVGNIMNNGAICNSSNRNKDNEYVTLAAPGEQAVWGRDNLGRTINEWGGTSMAVPQVAAAACLIRSINPELRATDIKNIIIDTGYNDIDGVAAPPELGGRVISIDNAVKMAIDKRSEKIEAIPDARPNIELSDDIMKTTSDFKDVDYRGPVKS